MIQCIPLLGDLLSQLVFANATLPQTVSQNSFLVGTLRYSKRFEEKIVKCFALCKATLDQHHRPMSTDGKGESYGKLHTCLNYGT